MQTAESERILPKTRLTDGLTLEMLLSANTGCPNVPISVAFFLFFLLKISFAVSLNLSVQAVHTCHVIVYQPDLFFAAMSSCASSTKVNAGSIKEYVPTRRSSRLTSSQSMNKMLTQYIGLALTMTIPQARSMIMQLMPLRPHPLRTLLPSTSTNTRRLAWPYTSTTLPPLKSFTVTPPQRKVSTLTPPRCSHASTHSMLL
jgi:hypothetical protein